MILVVINKYLPQVDFSQSGTFLSSLGAAGHKARKRDVWLRYIYTNTIILIWILLVKHVLRQHLLQIFMLLNYCLYRN